MSFLRRLFGQRPAAAPLPPTPPSKPASSAALFNVEENDKKTAPLRPSDVSAALGVPEVVITPPDAPPSSTLPGTKPIGDPDEELVKISTGDFKTNGTPNAPEIIEITADMYGGTRPLPPIQTYQSAPGKHLLYGINSDVGRQRSNNQDAAFTFFSSHVSSEERADFGIFAVADGMGGHLEGEKASAIATRIVSQYLMKKLYIDVIMASKETEKPIISEVVSEAIQKANDEVSTLIPEGGTTLTTVVIIGDIAYIGHVGDSRAYLVNSDNIEQITRDHSLVQRLIELDQLTPEEAQHHSQKNVLYRAIGQSENLEVDAITRRLPPGTRLLICSDGLWGLVNDIQLHEIIRSARSPQEAVDKMIAAANERGGPDNITAILIQIPG
jgi:serine/threonine protein phosphatase PrpC